MKSITVTFSYSTNTNDYTIEAVVFPGIKSPRGQFDRFQEPDDEDTAEITEVTDEAGVDHIAEFVFTGKQMREIEALAIEKAAEETEPEYED
jgi:hypothetical protein